MELVLLRMQKRLKCFASNRLASFCAGIDPQEEEKLKAVFNEQNPAPIFLQHYGGGSGLLSAEIFEALAKQGH